MTTATTTHNPNQLAPLPAHAAPAAPARGPRGLQLSTMAEMMAFAEQVIASGLAPANVKSPAAVLVAIQLGAELGLPPMAALQNIAVINGRPSIWGDAMLGVCRASGLFDESAFSESTASQGGVLTATCTVRRLPDGKPVTRSFSMADAKTAGLTEKAGPWQQYPRRMLQLRARSWALRDAFADVLRGLHAAEEAMHGPTEEEGPEPPASGEPESEDEPAEQPGDPLADEHLADRLREATCQREINQAVMEAKRKLDPEAFSRFATAAQQRRLEL